MGQDIIIPYIYYDDNSIEIEINSCPNKRFSGGLVYIFYSIQVPYVIICSTGSSINQEIL